MFSFSKICWYSSKTDSCFVCDCMKTLSKFLMTFLLKISGVKFLLIKAEKAAGPIDKRKRVY